MQPQELTYEQFSRERYQPLFEEIFREGCKPFNAEHFFPTWQGLMKLKFGRAWAVDDTAVLGAFFTNDLFSNALRVAVPFWFCAQKARHTGVARQIFEAMEQAAKAAGAVDIQAAAHENWAPSERAWQHQRHGFHKSETIFCKTL